MTTATEPTSTSSAPRSRPRATVVARRRRHALGGRRRRRRAAIEVHAPGAASSRTTRPTSPSPCGAGTTRGRRSTRHARREHGQECALDPRDPATPPSAASLAAGLSGHRRLRYGPLRDRVLEVRFVTADGRLVKGGGPDGQERDRLRPAAPARRVARHHRRARAGHVAVPAARRRRAAWSRRPTTDAVRAAARACSGRRASRGTATRTPRPARGARRPTSPPSSTPSGAEPVDGPPPWPDGPHRGRISVRPRPRRRARRARSPRRRRALARPRSASAPCTSPPTTADALAARPRRRPRPPAAGSCARRARPGSTASGAPRRTSRCSRPRPRPRSTRPGKLSPGRLPLDRRC